MENLRLRAEQVEPFVNATIETFKTMVKMKITQGEIRLRNSTDLANGVSGIIGLSGDAEGSITLRFPMNTARAVAGSFLGESDVSDSLMVDSIGELVNIISGFAKKDLPAINVNISLPIVIMGEKHEITIHSDNRKIVTRFDCALGEFHLDVYLDGLPETPERLKEIGVLGGDAL